jgi:TonB family protein
MQNRQRREKIRMLKGLALSLLLHLLILLLFWINSEKVFFTSPAKQEKRIALDLSQFVPPAPKPHPKPKPPVPEPVVPPIPEKVITPKPEPKKVVEKKPEPKKEVLDEKKVLVAKKDTEENNVTKAVKKEEKKVVKKEEKKEEKKIVKKAPKKPKKVAKKAPSKPKKRRVVHKKPKKRTRSSSLASALMNSGQSQSVSTPARRSMSNSSKNRIIKQLYGSEFDGFSSAQKKFIKNNLGLIHRITQMTLTRNGYPETAVRTGQEGVNVVSFYLHPNGNITGLRLDQRMGYEALDNNTLQVIKMAYKDYPLPQTKTKIKFYVQYSLSSY